MELSKLFCFPHRMRLRTGTVEPAALTAEAATHHSCAPCPFCQALSNQVHSSSTRTVADLPCSGWQIILRLRGHKMHCTNSHYPQRTFPEPTSCDNTAL